jgi:hypothetical protein
LELVKYLCEVWGNELLMLTDDDVSGLVVNLQDKWFSAVCLLQKK